MPPHAYDEHVMSDIKAADNNIIYILIFSNCLTQKDFRQIHEMSITLCYL